MSCQSGKVSTKRWTTARDMDVNEARVHMKNELGTLPLTDEGNYEAALVFAGRGRWKKIKIMV